jgi:hypothetical protein
LALLIQNGKKVWVEKRVSFLGTIEGPSVLPNVGRTPARNGVEPGRFYEDKNFMLGDGRSRSGVF